MTCKNPAWIVNHTNMSAVAPTSPGILVPGQALVLASYRVPDGREAEIRLAYALGIVTGVLDAAQDLVVRITISPDGTGASRRIALQDILLGAAVAAKAQVQAEQIRIGPQWTIEVDAFLGAGAGTGRASGALTILEYDLK